MAKWFTFLLWIIKGCRGTSCPFYTFCDINVCSSFSNEGYLNQAEFNSFRSPSIDSRVYWIFSLLTEYAHWLQKLIIIPLCDMSLVVAILNIRALIWFPSAIQKHVVSQTGVTKISIIGDCVAYNWLAPCPRCLLSSKLYFRRYTPSSL